MGVQSLLSHSSHYSVRYVIDMSASVMSNDLPNSSISWNLQESLGISSILQESLVIFQESLVNSSSLLEYSAGYRNLVSHRGHNEIVCVCVCVCGGGGGGGGVELILRETEQLLLCGAHSG